MTDGRTAIVVGAGHNGLACAASLAKAGLSVTVLEARAEAGGMSGAISLDGGYRFPGLAHTAFPVSPAIRKALDLDRHGYAPGASVTTRALTTDGRHIAIGDEITGDGPGDADVREYPAFRKQYLEFARAMQPLVQNRPPRLKDMDFADTKTLAKTGWKIRFGLGKESMYEFLRVAAINIFDVLNERFDDEDLKGAIAADAVMGHHVGPRTPGTVLNWLMRLCSEVHGPLSIVSGGETRLADALLLAAESNGVSMRLGAKVESIRVDKGVVKGVRLAGGETLDADIVISNADPRSTLLDLVGAPSLDAMFAQRATQIRGAGNVAKLHLCLNGAPGFTGLADDALRDRILISPTMRGLEHAFNHCKYGELPERPLLEITVPSAHNPELAPAGHHVMSVNVAHVPYKLKSGWESGRDALTTRVTDIIGEYAPGFASLIVAKELLTPADIERNYNVREGHWHHGETTIHQSFMMRPLHGAAQYDAPVDGLFLCGAGCHPGGGLTGLPGYNAARRVLELKS